MNPDNEKRDNFFLFMGWLVIYKPRLRISQRPILQNIGECTSNVQREKTKIILTNVFYRN